MPLRHSLASLVVIRKRRSSGGRESPNLRVSTPQLEPKHAAQPQLHAPLPTHLLAPPHAIAVVAKPPVHLAGLVDLGQMTGMVAVKAGVWMRHGACKGPAPKVPRAGLGNPEAGPTRRTDADPESVTTASSRRLPSDARTLLLRVGRDDLTLG